MKVIDRETLIGKRIVKLDAPEKASGQTRYVHDLDLPGQLHAKILRSTRVHARIRRIDASRARALPGVHAVLTAADVPYQRPLGVGKDQLPLKGDKVRSLRDEIAAVAADSEAIAEAALKLIEVDYEVLPWSIEIDDALKPDAAILHDHIKFDGKPSNIASKLEHKLGDLDAGTRWAEAEHLTADDELTYVREFEHLILARVLLARRSATDVDQATRLLERLLDAADDLLHETRDTQALTILSKGGGLCRQAKILGGKSITFHSEKKFPGIRSHERKVPCQH